jgi:hypothetical protein
MKGKWIVGVVTLALVVVAFGALPAPRALVVVASSVLPARHAAAANCTGKNFRSAASGDWHINATWQCETSPGTWVAADAPPTFTDGTITIRNGYTVAVAEDVIVDQTVVEAGGQVTVNSGKFGTNNGTGNEFTIYGTFLHSGTVADPMSGTGVLASGGTYIHNTTSSAANMVDFFDRGSVAADSTFIYRGSSTLAPAVSMSGQTYGNLTFESTSGAWSRTLSGTSATTIKGNFTLGSGVTLNNSSFIGLNLAGNWTNNGTFTAGTGTVTFSGSGTHNLTANVLTAFNNLTVNGTLVEMVSTDYATVSGTLTNNGTIRKSKSVSGGSNTFGLTKVQMNVNSGTGTIQVDRIDQNHPNATGQASNIATGKYWTISGSGFSVNLTLPHNGLSNPKVCKYPGGLGGAGWDCARDTSDGTTVTRNNITSFSDWAVGNNVGPTAITLSSLTAASPLPAALPVLGLITLGGLAAVAALGIGAVLVRRRRG